MSKTLDGVEYRKIGSRYRQCNRIRCTVCGAVTYADGPAHTEDCLLRTCNFCDTLKTAERRGILAQIFDREKKSEIKKRYSDGSKNRQIRHGLSKTPIYSRWLGMMSRCFDDCNEHWDVYGGRGITVCERWFDVYNFWLDMGQPPEGKELDRIDNDGNYEPSNCRWITPKQNNQNKRKVYTHRPENLGWWHLLGLKHNPYVYGPMPYKKTSLKHRREEAIERGWHTPKSNNPKYLN